jgi:streptogramin lyase
MTAGPDGNVWFSDFISVGRITPSGNVTRFPIASNSFPGGITTGPDGNIWFTLFASDHQRIGRISPFGGVVTEFPVFGGTLQLKGLTSGPDGNLWFTDPLSNQVGKMTTSGLVTLYHLPAGVTGPYEIVAGPDGALWFTSAFHIGRITTAGVVTTFADPGGDFPRGITVGSDGNIWFTESVANHIVRITPTGQMTDFTPPTQLAGPLDIVTGSDGNLWFIEAGVNKIGRLTPGPCTPSATALCLNNSRFKLEVAWAAPHQGTSGVGHPVALTSDTGYFWFFNAANVELVIKVLDARALNGYFWVFYGALSNVEYTITITDLETQTVKTFFNPADTLASYANTSAFGPFSTSSATAGAGMAAGSDAEGEAALFREEIAAIRAEQAAGVAAAAPADASDTCAVNDTTLCLAASRFRVRVDWEVPSQGTSGVGHAVPLTADTGYFWFFNAANVELVIKVLDARTINGKFWVFYGALSNVDYTIHVEDTVTGATKEYENRNGVLASVADTSAF